MRVVVVEYLGESMSKELLCKFHDNSAFDFDYTQSSIWSPLPSFLIQRKLGYDDEEEDEVEEEESLLLVNTLKHVTLDLKKKIATGACVLQNKIQNINNQYTRMLLRQRKKTKKNKASFDFSPSPVFTKRTSSSPTPRKGWTKLLKVASKRFKKPIKKKDPSAHIKLSCYPIGCDLMVAKFLIYFLIYVINSCICIPYLLNFVILILVYCHNQGCKTGIRIVNRNDYL